MSTSLALETGDDKNRKRGPLPTNLFDQSIGFVGNHALSLSPLVELPVRHEHCRIVFVQPVKHVALLGWRLV
ncbi:hypothetical protein D3C83_225900 [compost metagenome]